MTCRPARGLGLKGIGRGGRRGPSGKEGPHVRTISVLPGRAQDNLDDPADDGVISIAELMNMALEAVGAFVTYMLAKEAADDD